MKKILFIAALLAVFSVQPAPAADLMAQKSFTVAQKDDIKDTLAAAKGKVVVLNFFASWCPPCIEEIPDLIKLRNTVGKDKLVILGISVDENISAVTRMDAATKFNYPVFLAGSGIAQMFGVRSIPLNVVYAPDGSELYNDVGILDCDSVREYVQEAFK